MTPLTARWARAASRAAPSQFGALVGYAIGLCLPPKRRWLLLAPVAAAGLFGALATLGDGGAARSEAFLQTASLGIFSLVLPLTSLVVADAALGAEVRTGTIALTWLSPARFSTIVAARWMGACVVAMPALAAGGALSAVVAGVPEAAAATAVALAAGAAAHLAVFLLLGVIARRAAVWSIAFVVLFERLLGTALSTVAQLSPMWLAQGVFADLAPGGAALARDGVPQGWEAAGRLGLLTALALALAATRLRGLRLIGAAD